MRKAWTLLVLLAGLAGGIAFQRFVGMGNLVRLDYLHPVSEIKAEHQGKLRIFILAGQSNMEGQGSLSGYEPPPEPVAARLYAFRDFRWQGAQEPLGKRGVGLGVAFAEALAVADPQAAIGMVMAARGGTNIVQWQPSHDPESLYARMIVAARAASYQGEIAGVLFFQGENDTEGKLADHPNDWATYFEQFVEGLRHDLGNPDLPVVFAQIGGTGGLKDTVRAQQATVRIPHCAMVTVEGIPFDSTGVHYATPEYLEIGRRFAKAYGLCLK